MAWVRFYAEEEVMEDILEVMDSYSHPIISFKTDIFDREYLSISPNRKADSPVSHFEVAVVESHASTEKVAEALQRIGTFYAEDGYKEECFKSAIADTEKNEINLWPEENNTLCLQSCTTVRVTMYRSEVPMMGRELFSATYD